MANPFYYDGPTKPQDFLGRTDLVRRLADNLCSGESKSHGIIGGRRFGKSSVLAALGHELEVRVHMARQDKDDLRVLPISLSLHQATQPASANDVLGFVLHSIRQACHGSKPAPPFTGGPLIDFDLPKYQDKVTPASFEELEAGVVDIISAAYKKPGLMHIALLIDEIEVALDRPWTASLFGNIRSLIYDSRVKDFMRIVVVGSGRFLSASATGSPLLNVLETWRLQSFDEPAMGTLLAKAQGMSAQTAEAVVRQSGGHPFIAQYLLSHICDQGLDRVTPNDVYKFADQFRDEDRMEDLDVWWSVGLGENGRLAYCALCSTNDWMSVADVRNSVSVPDFQAARGLQALIYHGVAIRDANGRRYRVSGDLFRQWAEPKCAQLRRVTGATSQNALATSVTTSGGALVQGTVTVGRDMVGRDQYIFNYYATNIAPEEVLQADLAKATKLKPIFEVLTTLFSLEEFTQVCFDIGVTFDHLEGIGFKAKARDLILALDRASQIEVLIDEIRRQRPDSL